MMKAYRDPTEKELARMKVCILMGSPRKQGNTNALLAVSYTHLTLPTT